jgi:DNA-binding SARP family transcriptional activator/transcriptional regulator with XRE-family HTH domain/Tfp pilus assembly protein PilF
MVDGFVSMRTGFAAQLRRHRRAAGLSQHELAARAGLSVAAVRDLEQGRSRRPHPGSLQALVAALSLSDKAAAALRTAADGVPGESAARLAGPREDHRPDGPLRVGVLGPLTVHRGPTEVRLGRGRRRAVLGRLALSANNAVPVRDLLELVADGQAAPGAAQTYVSRLRLALEPRRQIRGGDGVIELVGAGYRLVLDADRLDLAVFRRLVNEAKQAALPRPDDALDRLDSALGLWRGTPLADVPELRDHPLVVHVMEERIAAALRHADLAQRLGRSERSLPLLRALTADHLLHEPLHGRLIIALAASGLQAAALAVYDDIRRRLGEELGIDPGTDLAEIHRRVLRQDLAPAAPPSLTALSKARREVSPEAPSEAPAQLPADTVAFTGRDAEMAELDRMRGEPSGDACARVIAICGPAGSGKTSAAVHWAHRIRDDFPDGQLYVNLRGYDPTAPMPVAEALGRFLRALGVAPARVPADPDEAAGLYRSVLAGRRLLVVLDNALNAAQVRPLLPAGAAGLVLVTSRNRLSGLVALDGARRLDLAGLRPDGARSLLNRLVGAPRARAEPRALDQLAALCSGLPLALRIAAAAITDDPSRRIGDYVDRVRAAPVEQLRLADDEAAGVRAAFDSSYERLPDTARAAFRLLGVIAGGDFGLPAAAQVIGTDLQAAERILRTLTGVCLIDEPGPGRFAFHDLIREYARERLHAEESPAEVHEAVGRLLDWYLSVASAANDVLTPTHRAVTPSVTRPVVPVPFGPERDEVLAFLEREASHLPGMVRLAVEHGHHTAAWHLTYLLAGFFDLGTHAAQAIEATRWGVEAACRLDDPVAERIMRNTRAALCNVARLPQQAIEDLHRVIALAKATGATRGEAHGENNLGRALRQLGRPTEAIEAYQRSLALLLDAGDQPESVAITLNNLGNVYAHIGQFDRAADSLDRAMRQWDQLGSPAGRTMTLNSLGKLHQRTGTLAAAERRLAEALTLAREYGQRALEVDALIGLGLTLTDTGRHDEARDHLDLALSLAHQSGTDPDELTARTALARLSLHRDDLDGAAAQLDAALALAATVTDPLAVAFTHRTAASLATRRSDHEAAGRYGRQALALFEKAGAGAEAAEVRSFLRGHPEISG